MILAQRILILSALALCLGACNRTNNSLESAISRNAQSMQVRYSVVSNTAELQCDNSLADGNCYAARLELTFSDALPDSGWSIYFGHLSPIQSETSHAFDIIRINGDLHQLIPNQAIQAGSSYSIDLIGSFWSVSKSDVLPNYFFAYQDGLTQVIQSTQEYTDQKSGIGRVPHASSFSREEQTKRNANDNSQVLTSEQVFAQNIKLNDLDNQLTTDLNIIPSMRHIDVTGEQISLADGLAIADDILNQFPAIRQFIANQNIVINPNGLPLKAEQRPFVDGVTGQYSIDIDTQQISVIGHDDAGLFYGLVSLIKMLNNKSELALAKVSDAPRFSFRGVHLDVARNFRSKAFVLSLLDQMAYLKLNKLHLHLADDEGWRLQIEGLDELTSVGAYRCFDLSETQCLLPQLGSGPNRESPVNGYYSSADYIELVKYAEQRQIEIIPSLDMPGHSRAAVKAMAARYQRYMQLEDSPKANEYRLTDPQDTTQYSSVQHYNDNTLNPCIDSSYHFIDTVLNHVIGLHESAGAALRRYHIGADETAGAWDKSPACQALIDSDPALDSSDQLTAYFVKKVADMVQSKGIIAGGWSDGLAKIKKTKPMNMQVNVWDPLMWQGHEHANQFANQGWQTVLSFPDVLYFDFPYAVSPDEPGYYWATRATDSYKVFQFMPEHLAEHDTIWRDRMNKTFSSNRDSELDEGISFTGIQAQLWSEIVRLDSSAEYMLYPRLISFAERAWTMPEWESNYKILEPSAIELARKKDWNQFSQRMVNQELPHLARHNITFRIASPGVQYRDGLLYLNHQLNGMVLEFKSKGGQWQTYRQPSKVSGQVYVRARVPNTDRVSRTLEVR